MEKREEKAAPDATCTCEHKYIGHYEFIGGPGTSFPDKTEGCGACDCKKFVDKGLPTQLSPNAPEELLRQIPEVAHRPPHLAPLRSPSRTRKESAVDMKAAKLKHLGAPEELKQALLDQLKRVIAKPIGPKMLKELAKTALLSQRLLITAGDPNALPGRRRGMGMPYGVDAVFADDDDMGFDGPMPIAPPAETFGASAIRELIAATKEKNKPGVVELTKALGIAKKEGLDEVAKNLQAQLLEQPSTPGAVDIENVPTGGWPGDQVEPPVAVLAHDVNDILDGEVDPEGGAV